MRAHSIQLKGGEYLGSVVRRVSAADVTLVETSYTDRAPLVSHQHASPTLFMMLRGTFHGAPGDSGFQRSGMVTYHPTGQVHGAGQFRGSMPRGFNVELGASWHHACAAVPATLDGGAVPWLLSSLYRECRSLDDASTLAIHGLVCQLVAELNRRQARMTRDSAATGAVARVVEILHAEVSAIPEWSVIAGCVGCEPDALARAFRERLGTWPAAYLRGIRLERARRELAESARPIAEIAASAGFYDQPHFSRAFKVLCGMTPAAYRRLVRGS